MRDRPEPHTAAAAATVECGSAFCRSLPCQLWVLNASGLDEVFG